MNKTRMKLLEKEVQLQQVDPQARRQAAAVLEVLAGVRTPEAAAQALEVSLPTYFQLETRALRGLIWSCTPNPPGRQQALGKKLRQAEAKAAQLQHQLHRYQALLRTMQRSIGLPPETPKPTPAGKGRRRKPAVRALRAIGLLNQTQAPVPVAAATVSAAPLAAPGTQAG